MSVAEAILRAAQLPNCSPATAMAAAMLAQPWEGANHRIIEHPKLGGLVACEAENRAQRFVFCREVLDVAFTLGETPEDYSVAIDHAQLPFEAVAFEVSWVVDLLYLLRRRGSGYTGAVYFAPKGCALPLATLDFDPVRDPLTRYELDAAGWALCDFLGSEAAEAEFSRTIFAHLPVLLTAFLGLNGCVDVEAQLPSRQMMRRANRTQKPCLLSYNRVTLKRSPKLADKGLSSSANGVGMRRHSVMGHFRELRKGRLEPVFIWVHGHWRGDARKGVVVKEREVEARRAVA
ncbi:hypothetical protein ACMG4P_04825 [Pseudovibrio denitrificans]|uniref:hypothetical protein n=1 Tax=Pseudovibrio denitrificans TaxID=258256 RepID=UPI0039BF0C55